MDDSTLELEGKVVDLLPGNMFKVKVDGMPNLLLCYLSGKLKQNKIRVIMGDEVKIQVSCYDLSKGRISYRI